MTTSKSPAAPARVFSCCTVRSSVARTLAASPVAMPVTWVWAYVTPACAWAIAACLFTDSNWSRIWLNSTMLTMITTVPATAIVIAPMRTCSEERHERATRAESRRTTSIARRPVSAVEREISRPIRGSSGSRGPSGSSAAGGTGAMRGRAGVSGSESSVPVELAAVVRPSCTELTRSRWAGLVAHPADRQHDLGLLRIALDLGAQPLHVDVDQPGVGRVPVAPHLLEEQLAGEHLARLAGQRDQQVELQRRELDGHAVAGHLVGGDVDLHVADGEVLRLAGLAAAQLGPHAGDQLDRLERLGHVVVGAGLQPLDDVDRVALGGQHHDRHGRLLADVLADLQAVAARQHQVQQDDVGARLLEDADRPVAVGHEGRFVAFAPQHDAQHLGEGGVVVD